MKTNIALLSMLLIGCGGLREAPSPVDKEPVVEPRHRVLDPICTNPIGASDFKDEHARLAINAVPCYTSRSAPIFVTEHLCDRGVGLDRDQLPYIEVKVEDRSGSNAALTYIYAYVERDLKASWALHTETGQPCTPRDGNTPLEVQQWLNRDTSNSWYCAKWRSAMPESTWCYPL